MIRSSLLLITISLFTFSACTKSDNPGENSGNEAKLQLVLTDAPADYEAVFVSVKEVRINVGSAEAEGVPEGASDGNWVNYPLSPELLQPVNLLDLTNGDHIYMGEPLALPAGKISQIRLILNETGNTVVLRDGTIKPLTTPSAQQSGLKINLNQTLEPGKIYKVWLDFDADKSVVARGNGAYNLKPVIKAMLESATFGAISGIVLPYEAGTSIYAIRAGSTDTVARTIPEPAGSPYGLGFYKFGMLDPGTYNISLNAADTTGYMDSLIQNVVVKSGEITPLGTSNLHK